MAKVSELQDATELLPPEASEHTYVDTSVFKEGTKLGSYQIEAVIGEGGGGTVYSARHRLRGHRVAIKVLRAEMVPFPSLVTRFMREAEAVTKIRHPNIVEIFEFGELERGQPYYVMELLEGMDLRKLLGLHGRFSPVEVLELLEPVCDAVQAAHEAGFIHRDIKANNVLIVDSNAERVVKLLDFGIAKMLHGEPTGQGLTEPGARLGTAHNMAPEQIRCEKLDTRADIYALGVLTYQLLTGEYPFDAEDPRQIALLHLQSPAPRPSARAPVPPAVDAVVLRCLEKQADRRFATADELIAAFRSAVGRVPSGSAEHYVQALGVYVELATGSAEEIDDLMFEDISQVLDIVEQGLAEHEFLFPLRTSNALLAARILDSNVDPVHEREQAFLVLSQLHASLVKRNDPHPDVHFSISLTIDEARCRSSAAGTDIIGGALLEVGSWTREHRVLSA